MKRLIVLFMLAAFALPVFAHNPTPHKMVPRYNTITKKWTSYPEVSIHDIQFVPPESLAVADAHQVSGDVSSPYWTSQVSSYMGDTVVVTAIVVTPAAPYDPWYGLTFTQHGWTMLLHDTAANSNQWGGILVRVGNGFANPGGPDTAQARADFMLNPERGDVIQITGWVEEFPTQRLNSTTQFRPYPGIPISIVGSHAVPAPTRLNVSSFYTGGFPGGAVNYSAGEPYEGSLVELVNLNVNGYVNFTRGTWAMTDNSSNYIADYDASHFYTKGNESPTIVGDPSFTMPPIGGVVDTIRGTMLTVSGGENARGYRMCPLYSSAAIPGYSGDVIYGVSLPTVITHRRYPVVVTATDHPSVQARVFKTAGGYDITSAHLMLSINGAAWEDRPMSLINLADSTYEAIIQDIDTNPYDDGTSIRYFIKGIDDHGYSQLLANSSSSFSHDTSQGFFFYTVHNSPLSIYDVQYTPYPNGRSGYLGGAVAVSGIVTADTTDVVTTQTGTFGTTAWYIQNGSSPWNGMWVVNRDSASFAALTAMKRGDSVTVYGTVEEIFEVTQILDSTAVIHSHNRPLPAPVVLTTADFNSGNVNMEPYESMLVKVVTSTVSDVAPVFAEPWEFSMDNSGGSPMIVRRDGTHSYSNVEGDTVTDKKILHVSDRVDTLIGVCYFSHNNWKAIPRKDDDIVAGEPYQYLNGWNMLSIGRSQLPSATGYDKTVLFPTAASNAFYYDAGYLTATTLQPTIGYWLKFNSGQTIRQLGAKRTADTVHLKASWNLVGGLGNPVPVSTLTVSAGNSLSTFFGYNGAYFVEDTLKPSKGYWVKADIDGYFYESAPAMMPKNSPPAVAIKEFNTLVISDNQGHAQKLYFGQDTEGKMIMRNYEMPPAGPDASEFSARYASGRILEAYPAVINKAMEFGIAVNAKNGPLKLSWNVVNPQGKHFTISDRSGKALKATDLSGTGEVTLSGSGVINMNLTVNGGALPKEFALSQNYPNPFNPSTKIEVSLPQSSRLDVAVFNLLGQKVATLAGDTRDAGYYTLTWNGDVQNGSPAATGIYFVRMSAQPEGPGQGFSSVRKIMLMK